MRNVSRVSLAVGASAILIGSLALPASAADTTATVVVPVGEIGISAPTSAPLSSLTPGGTASAAVSGVTVTDNRAGEAGWVVQVVLSDFVGVTPLDASQPNKISASLASYAPGVAAETGTSTVAATTQSNLSVVKTVQTATGVVGNNTAAWDATLSVTAPTDALADTYTAKLTHSVL